MMTLGFLVWGLVMWVIFGAFYLKLKHWDRDYKKKLLLEHHEFMHNLYSLYYEKWYEEERDVTAMFNKLGESFNNMYHKSWLHY